MLDKSKLLILYQNKAAFYLFILNPVNVTHLDFPEFLQFVLFFLSQAEM